MALFASKEPSKSFDSNILELDKPIHREGREEFKLPNIIFNKETKKFDLDIYGIHNNLHEERKRVERFNKKAPVLMICKKELKTTFESGDEICEISFEEGDVVYITSTLFWDKKYYMLIDGINGYSGLCEMNFDTIEDSTGYLCVKSDSYNPYESIFNLIFNDEYFEVLDTHPRIRLTLKDAIDITNTKTTEPIYIKYTEDDNHHQLQIYTNYNKFNKNSHVKTSTSIEWEDLD